MVRVDVCGLDVYQTLRVLGRRAQTFSEQLGQNLDELCMQLGEPCKLLQPWSVLHATRLRKGKTYGAGAIVADLHELLIHQLDAA